MRKSILFTILCLTFFYMPVMGETLRIGAFCEYFAPQDTLIQEIYGESGDVLYGVRINCLIFQGLQVTGSYGQYKKIGTTTELDDVTRLTLNPFTLGIRYSPPLGTITPFAELAYVNLTYKEEADIGRPTSNSGKKNGWMIMAGVEFMLSERFILSLELKTQNIDGPMGTSGTLVSFKGMSAGLCFYVRI